MRKRICNAFLPEVGELSCHTRSTRNHHRRNRATHQIPVSEFVTFAVAVCPGESFCVSRDMT